MGCRCLSAGHGSVDVACLVPTLSAALHLTQFFHFFLSSFFPFSSTPPQFRLPSNIQMCYPIMHDAAAHVYTAESNQQMKKKKIANIAQTAASQRRSLWLSAMSEM